MRQLVSITIRPLNASVGDVRRALERLAEEDPTFRVEMNAEDASVTIYGMGELHLEIILDRLKREHNVVIHAESYKIEYVETIRQSAEAEGKFIHQTSKRGQYGHVKIRSSQIQGRGVSSSTRSTMTRFLRNSSNRSRKGSRKRSSAACSPATRWST